jgi:hypothetical protein
MLTNTQKRRKNAEKQRRFRQVHLKEGNKMRLQCNLTTGVKRNLERLAHYYGCSITEMLETLINAETNRLLQGLSGSKQTQFYEFELQCNPQEQQERTA